jgi:acyl carrier protein
MTVERLKAILRSALQLGERADALTPSSRLLGAIPEFDSMAVVSVLTMIEDEFGVTIADDEISAETFETLGSLTAFVDGKVSD